MYSRNSSDRNSSSLTPEQKQKGRKARNIASAKRSRDRLKHSDHWVMLQIEENKDLIKALEKQIDDLADELEAPSHTTNTKKKYQRNDDRPKWFGEPF